MRLAILISLFAVAIGGRAAHAVCPTDTCTTGTTTRQCDAVCGFPTSAGTPCAATTSDCNADGAKVTCGSTLGANYIVGTNNADVICGRSGNDTIRGVGGNDTINAGDGDDVVQGEAGADEIEGGLGSDTIDGGTGDDVVWGVTTTDSSTDDGGNLIVGGNNDDTLVGAGGDDEVFGDDGDDTLLGQGGRDVLMGGDDDDFIGSIYLGAQPNDVLGTILCGGAGDDGLVGDGAGHQCLDGGTDQQVTGINDFDCQYSNLPSDADDHDVGTFRNCANPGPGFSATRNPSCGCD